MSEMIERLADLEHQQWAHWTKYMLDNLTPENIERWHGQIETPYADLTEKEKDSDREWAVKSLKAVRKPTEAMGKIGVTKIASIIEVAPLIRSYDPTEEIYLKFSLGIFQAMIDAAIEGTTDE